MHNFFPALRASTAAKNLVLNQLEKVTLGLKFSGTLVKMLYAFLWQVLLSVDCVASLFDLFYSILSSSDFFSLHASTVLPHFWGPSYLNLYRKDMLFFVPSSTIRFFLFSAHFIALWWLDCLFVANYTGVGVCVRTERRADAAAPHE